MIKYNENINNQFDEHLNTGTQYYSDAEYVLTMSEEITATISQVNEAIQNVSTTAQKSSEDTSLIKSSIDDAVSDMKLVRKITESQTEFSKQLNNIVQRFKI
ncbi:methyl-accepting chemotaxis protein [Clostridium sp. DL-VIII]|uniref:methyl-accepting chemotaxis protein n=1 Tax=Clostridium sp. DL-VIII TaxID=641107 RepID=UPI0005555B7A|nr:methyl-accepting chemotaxis protein [Clostridium sp. DL-VIII]